MPATPEELFARLAELGIETQTVRHPPVFTVEEAVRKMTSLPANRLGLADRGILRQGMKADVVVFDPDTIGAGPLRRVRDFPGDADRLVADAFVIDASDIDARLRQHLSHLSVKDAVDVTVQETGQPRRQIYARAVALAREGGKQYG